MFTYRSVILILFRHAPRTGVSMWFGPIKYSDLWFDGFEQNDVYDTGAIGLKRDSPYVFSIKTEYRDIQCAFDDGVSIFCTINL